MDLKDMKRALRKCLKLDFEVFLFLNFYLFTYSLYIQIAVPPPGAPSHTAPSTSPNVFFFSFLETRSHYVALADTDLSMRLDWPPTQ